MLRSFVEQTRLQKELVYTFNAYRFHQHTHNALSNRRDNLALSRKNDTISVNCKTAFLSNSLDVMNQRTTP